MSYNIPIKSNLQFVEFVKANCKTMTVPKLLIEAQKQGLTTYGIDTVRRLIRDLGLGFKKPRPPQYTSEELAFIRDNQHLDRKDLLIQFNEKFNRRSTQAALNIICTKHKFRTKHPSQFTKGFNGWRNGEMVFELKGVAVDNSISEHTRFKKGQKLLFNQVPVGYERKDKRGFTEIRVDDGASNRTYGGSRNWKLKHHFLWEQVNGEIPKNHCITFKDGNIENFDIDNLMLMPRGAINTRNALNYKEQPAEIKPVINAIAKLIHKTNQLEKS